MRGRLEGEGGGGNIAGQSCGTSREMSPAALLHSLCAAGLGPAGALPHRTAAKRRGLAGSFGASSAPRKNFVSTGHSALQAEGGRLRLIQCAKQTK